MGRGGMKRIEFDESWIRVSTAADGMGMTPQGALKRLKRLNGVADGRLLRREDEGSPWLVSVDVLIEMSRSQVTQDETIEKLKARISDVEVKLLGLRNSHNAHRRRTTKRLDTHERALKVIRRTNKELECIFGGEKLNQVEPS